MLAAAPKPIEDTYHGYAHADPPHQPLYLDLMLKHLRAERAQRVLDAGCGDGNFGASLAEAGYRMYGTLSRRDRPPARPRPPPLAIATWKVLDAGDVLPANFECCALATTAPVCGT
jgi:hypothetical protein